MKMNVETQISVDGADTIQVGMSASGLPALLVVVGSQRVTLELSDDDAIGTAHALIFAVMQLRQMRRGRPPGMLIAPDGSAINGSGRA